MSLHNRSVAELAAGLRKREFSAVELAEHCLQRVQHAQDQLNCMITISAEQALAAAAEADQSLARNEAGPLTGIPLLHKDIFCTRGVRTSCGSRMLDNFVAPYDATVVERLNRAGAVSLGKTNMDEFAMGSSNETSYYGAVRNPWDVARVPGGSSGGSAAAIAAGAVPLATGTDTGGSIRQPAALSGVTGFKPTYGRVSRYGMIAFASSLDQAGGFARSAEDLAWLMQSMAGHDPLDSTSANVEVPDYLACLEKPLAGLRLGKPREFFAAGLDAGVAKVIEEALEVYVRLGAKIVDISLPASVHAVPTYYVVVPAEASSNLSRYDGVRYGHRCADPVNLDDLYRRSRGEGFGREVQRRIMIGTYVLSHGYFDAYYLQAQKVRQLIADDFNRAFDEVDFVVGPTTQSTAFCIGEKVSDPVAMYLNDVYTISANLAGLPGASVPAGFVDGLPVGLQLIGPHFSEGPLLSAAHGFQRETDWHQRRPEGWS